jgi:hypothetical protein
MWRPVLRRWWADLERGNNMDMPFHESGECSGTILSLLPMIAMDRTSHAVCLLFTFAFKQKYYIIDC